MVCFLRLSRLSLNIQEILNQTQLTPRRQSHFSEQGTSVGTSPDVFSWNPPSGTEQRLQTNGASSQVEQRSSGLRRDDHCE